MKIVILQDYLRCGGTEHHSIFLTKKLNEHHFPTRLITFRPHGPLASTLDPHCHHTLQSTDLFLDFYAPRLCKTLSKANPDCILCMGTIANSFGEYLKYRLNHKKIITTVRTGKKIPLLYKRSLLASDLILCNCNWAKNQLINKGIPEQKLQVIYNPLLRSKTNVNDLHLRQYSHANHTIVVFICVQNFREGKRHRQLIEYFSQLDPNSDWQLWLVGAGKTQKKCEYLVNKLNLQAKIHFFGAQTDPRPFYKEADVAVSVSQEDALPNFLLEAQQWGLPVIAMDTGGVQEAFVPNKTGFLVNKNDAKTFIRHCNYFIHNSNEIQALGTQAMQFCEATFSPKKQLLKLINVLENL